MTIYKGETINKVMRFGYVYYKISGSKKLYTTLKAAKADIDAKKGE